MSDGGGVSIHVLLDIFPTNRLLYMPVLYLFLYLFLSVGLGGQRIPAESAVDARRFGFVSTIQTSTCSLPRYPWPFMPTCSLDFSNRAS